MGLREQILAAKDLKSQVVEVPEWGVTVELREFSVAARLAWRDQAFEPSPDGEGNTPKPGWDAALIVACLFDPETNAPIFGPDEIGLLQGKAAGPLGRLLDVALDINGLRAEASQDAEKNSAETSSAEPSSD